MLLAPLLPAALVVVVCALAGAAGLPGAPLAMLAGVICSGLALASVGRRRLVWVAAASAAFGLAARSALPYMPLPALPSLEAERALLARPIGLLIPAPESAILLGIVLGERAEIPRELSQAFAVSGTTHLLAISGFNMTLVAGAVALALRSRLGPAWSAAACVLAIALYSVLVGGAASVLRAALMSAVAAVGVATGRRAATANALCAAVTLMLMLDPGAVADVGLQLSALATAGLVVLQPEIASRLTIAPAPVRGGLATTIAATAPTLPVIAGVFGRVSLVSPLANLVCVPLFPILMLSGAATSLVGSVSPDLARPVAMLAFASALALRVAVEAFAAVPFAALTVPDGPATGVAVALLEVAVVRWGPSLRHARPDLARLRRFVAAPHTVPPRLAAVVLGMALVPAVVATALPSTGDAVRVVALDVGQGDAYLVELEGTLLLIDGGPDPARLLEELGATLPPWRRRIDVVALTHAHTDHGAGLVALFDRYEIGLAIEPVGLNPSILTDLWSAAIAKAGVPRRAVRAGDRIDLGGASVEVLAPDPDLLVDTPDLVLRVRDGPFSALFTGDVVEDAQLRLLAHPEMLRARLYVPPHHGAATPYAVALRDAAAPEVALISVGAGNRYGHPTPETLAALAGITTYRTDHDGTVEISLDGTVLVARAHANGLPPPRRGPLPYTPAGG